MSFRIFLADDHAIVREGLRYLLEAQGDMVVVGEAGNGREALQGVLQLRPDAVIMDVAMPELNGIEATQQIRQALPSTQVVILSVHANSEHVFRALRAGANGYLLKESAGQDVVEAVRDVCSGHRFLSHQIGEVVLQQYFDEHSDDSIVSPLDCLTSREREILQLVVEGKSSAEIAGMLCLSPKTVETYRGRLMDKLKIHDLPKLVKFAIQHGLIDLE
jgi:DNA-binding NarL/FixJ family response regulator